MSNVLTTAELKELFGDFMPNEAANMILNPPPGADLNSLRIALQKMAEDWEKRTDPIAELERALAAETAARVRAEGGRQQIAGEAQKIMVEMHNAILEAAGFKEDLDRAEARVRELELALREARFIAAGALMVIEETGRSVPDPLRNLAGGLGPFSALAQTGGRDAS